MYKYSPQLERKQTCLPASRASELPRSVLGRRSVRSLLVTGNLWSKLRTTCLVLWERLKFITDCAASDPSFFFIVRNLVVPFLEQQQEYLFVKILWLFYVSIIICFKLTRYLQSIFDKSITKKNLTLYFWKSAPKTVQDDE